MASLLDARLVCPACGAELELGLIGRCPSCRVPLEARGDLLFAHVRPGERCPLRRYAGFLALGEPVGGGRPVGATPLVRAQVSRLLRGVEIDLKLELANPGGAVADRGAAACVGYALARGIRTLVSTDGDVSAALARHLAPHGPRLVTLTGGETRCDVRVGADCRGSRADEADQRLMLGAMPPGWMLVEHSGPIWKEGMVTLGLELAETTEARPPDAVIVPGHWGPEALAVAEGFARWDAAQPGRPRAEVTIIYPTRSGGGEVGPGISQSVTARDVAAALELARDEEGLRLDEAAGGVFAAAIRYGRSLSRGPGTFRIVAVLEAASAPGLSGLATDSADVRGRPGGLQ